ncbi:MULTISPECIES: GNAT family N-acetyltransferase [unclassified Rhizobium]|uniref:GNAT family N-acetyltransferase n=1 Tax=unclassified Rhizobium TaxID=2613769 RepID=UPI0007EA11AB|nr:MULTISPECIES: GNAT family N-acetyltransferase [unclassified Rhizobium]ANM11922.1 GCN5-related N-acetyltransferase protein [Rhizobium sp. N324]ANM18414.1 GCN5-related N-acetyltransferase protein [Rhizobium sp. N541]ANM24800.1 GCN5-related N-acetyltransferase protein [Rhizobium sp. N941]OWV86158.1 GCN5 family acetyltransferase [Rhizobium sp. N122]OYD05527.1 GCN5-related N-acetyltransferase protein [Rhizobium sp. N4311]
MNSEFAVRSMRPGELELVLEWARQEGWNPGLDDSLAFLEADPSGFFVGAIGEVPVGSISVVKYGESFAFLGLYIVHPDFRGKGYGKAIWETGISSAGHRTIGLDGVAAQQDNYRKAGFEPAYSTIRYGGVATTLPVSALAAHPVMDSRLEGLQRFDSAIFPQPRDGFLAAWCTARKGRRSAVVRKSGKIRGYGTIRRCYEGYKIGPLFANDADSAAALLAELIPEAKGAGLFIDVPAENHEAVALAEGLGLQPVFETTRMYRGPAPATPLKHVFGVTTLELG